MITIDIYEEQLIALCQSCLLPFKKEKLEFGDICFGGKGPNESSICIGVERKTIPDLLMSMRSSRLLGFQLPGCLDLYQRCYLIVEGRYGINEYGMLQYSYSHKGPPISYSELNHFLATIEEVGVRVYRTMTIEETLHFAVERYKWWQKPWEDHKAHQSLYAPAPLRQGMRRPNLTTRMAAQIPGIATKAWQVGDYFKSPQSMCNASEDRWAECLTIRDGKTKVRKIVKALQEDNE